MTVIRSRLQPFVTGSHQPKAVYQKIKPSFAHTVSEAEL